MKSREKIVILDRGSVELAFPSDWTVKPDPAGHLTLIDPTDNCKLEISYMTLPPVLAAAIPLPELLANLLAGVKDAGPTPTIVAEDRGDLWFAWSDYSYETDDTDKGMRRLAHGRILIASNKRFQVLVTYNYWHDDRKWATRAWDRMFATLRLGDGRPLENPYEHWSLRDAPR